MTVRSCLEQVRRTPSYCYDVGNLQEEMQNIEWGRLGTKLLIVPLRGIIFCVNNSRPFANRTGALKISAVRIKWSLVWSVADAVVSM